MKAAIVGVGMLLASQIVFAQESLRNFIQTNQPSARWALQCFQNGERIIVLSSLRIRPSRQRDDLSFVSRSFVKENGHAVNITPARGMVCLMEQTGGTVER